MHVFWTLLFCALHVGDADAVAVADVLSCQLLFDLTLCSPLQNVSREARHLARCALP